MLSALFAVSAAVKAQKASGNVNSIDWSFADGVLTLSGNGAIPDYNDGSATTPWGKQTFTITKEETTLLPGVPGYPDGYPYTTTTTETKKLSDLLTKVIISEDITSVGISAFQNMPSLVTIELPSSITSVKANAFQGCTNLKEISWSNISENVSIENTSFAATGLVKNKMMFVGTQLVFVYTDATSADITGATKIHANAFKDCNKITSITIPSTVTAIGSNAFANCTSLTNVTFGNVSKITSWGSNIFSGVTGKTVGDYKMIGNSVILKAISNSAPDARYEISNNVAYIADNAFADVNNSTVYLDLRGRDNAPVLASSALNGIAGFKTIVKNGKEGNFNSKVWSNINTTTIEVPSEKYTTCMFMYNAVVPEGIAVYTAKSNAEGKVVLTKINKNNARTVVPAGVGFMLRADNKTTATFVSAKSEAAVFVNENELKGAEDYTYFTGDENPYVYILSTVDGKQGFYRAGSTNKLKIGKAYLQSNTQMHSLAKMSLWEGESETSGISDAHMSENSNAKGYVYNLNGSRMSSPQKGVNIINGKKVIIK